VNACAFENELQSELKEREECNLASRKHSIMDERSQV
jgi:hypothetical protein